MPPRPLVVHERRSVSIYRINEGELDIPSEWADKSVNVFAVGNSLPLALSFLITWEEIDSRKELATYVDQNLDDLAHQLKGLTILERRQVEFAGATALEAEFTWRGDGGLMYQRQTYIRTGSRVLVFTASSRRELREEHREQIDAVLSSLRLVDAG